jgi:hypothetical protein
MSTTDVAGLVKQALVAKLEQCQEKLRALAASLPETLIDLELAEHLVRGGVLEIGRELLQAWSEVADAQAARPDCQQCDERTRHKGYVSGPLVTTLGTIDVRRPRYRCTTCGREHYPHDAQLRFGAHAVSWLLAKVLGRLGAQLPFEQAVRNLKEDYGISLSKHTLEQVCQEAGQVVLNQEDAQRQMLQQLPPQEQPAALPESTISPQKAYVLADGTMLHAEGAWQEIRVASVAAVNAADEVLKVQHRARFLGCADFGWQLLLLAHQVGYQRATYRVFLADGARWLWELADMHFPDAIQILDWYHLAEHVHGSAAILFGEGNPAARRWSESRKAELWNGQVAKTLRCLRSLLKSMRAKSKRETLRQLIGYLENNRRRINYPRYRALGLRVGSGQVEGACKTLVGGRCKQAGMRNWNRPGAEGVLRLRAALQTNDYHALWDHHLKIAA